MKAGVRGQPAEVVVDDDWRADAACRLRIDGVEPHDWFSEGRWATAATMRAKAVCAECPVRELCLGYALQTRQPWGVWAGLSPYERGTDY